MMPAIITRTRRVVKNFFILLKYDNLKYIERQVLYMVYWGY